MWQKLNELPDKGHYWYFSDHLEEPLLVQVVEVYEPAGVHRTGFHLDEIRYKTIRLCEGLKVWPDKLMMFPSMWAEIHPPTISW